jgi:hypothetical protein
MDSPIEVGAGNRRNEPARFIRQPAHEMVNDLPAKRMGKHQRATRIDCL